MRNCFLTILAIYFSIQIIEAQKISEWQPENRTWVSAETGLKKSWPETAPTLLRSDPDLAKGYSSPSFGASTIYINVNTATIAAKDILFAINMDGKIRWQTEMGRGWTGSNPLMAYNIKA
jgi:hypothetical protein